MAEQNQQHGRRPHFHRGRRGADRRATDRRAPSREHAPETTTRETPRDGGVDVEQIMREIRSRIAQRHGIELSNPQIQELAARRLEAILEPRNIKPQLLEQLRKSAGTGPDIPAASAVESYEFEETTLYDTHRGILRFIRNLLNPILKLFFNPLPLIAALNTQARINKELAAREAERERRQSEWNALQYELIQRAVLEMSRVSIEMQGLANRVESLSAKVDFNERRVRSMENVPSSAPQRPARQQEPVAIAAAPSEAPSPDQPTGEGAGEATRRRRRRRRGRRGGGGAADAATTVGAATAAEDEADVDVAEGDEEEVTALEAESMPAAPDTPRLEEQARPLDVVTAAAPPAPQEPQSPSEAVVPSPPRDEPDPANTADHAEPGPVDR